MGGNFDEIASLLLPFCCSAYLVLPKSAKILLFIYPHRTMADVLDLPEVLLTDENSSGGILVATLPGYGPSVAPTRKAFFSDTSVDRGPVMNRFIEWFDLWGMPLAHSRGKDGPFERSFFTQQWPLSPIPKAHGPQMVPKIAERIEELTATLAQRQPRLVIFLSCYLWQAINLPEAIAVLEPYFGKPLETGRRITSARLAAYRQRWEKTLVVALPMPSKNTGETYVRSLASDMQQALASTRELPRETEDPLLETAREWLILDKEASVRSFLVNLHVNEARAEALFAAMVNKVWEPDVAGRPKLKR